MKTIRFAALGAALVFGVSTIALAQAPAGARGGRRQGAVAGADAPRRGEQNGQRAILRGIQLSDAQKAQFRTIQQKYTTERQTLMQQVRGDRSAATRPDSATRERLRIQTRSLMERQLGEMRGILTAEQRQTFDSNVSTMRERLATRDGKAGQKAARRRPGA